MGGFTPHTLAEDADLTIAIVKAGYKVLYDEEAVGLTEAPDTIRGLVRQRYRWMFGTAQAACKHRDCLFRPKYRAMGLIGLPNIVLFQVLFPLISPILDVTLAFSLCATLASRLAEPGPKWQSRSPRPRFTISSSPRSISVTSALAFHLEPAEDKRLLAWLIPQRFVYRQLMYYVAMKSALAALRGFEVGWGQLDRKATVSPNAGNGRPQSGRRRRPGLRTCRSRVQGRPGPVIPPPIAGRPMDEIAHAQAAFQTKDES